VFFLVDFSEAMKFNDRKKFLKGYFSLKRKKVSLGIFLKETAAHSSSSLSLSLSLSLYTFIYIYLYIFSKYLQILVWLNVY